jgi:hypothetical protein
MMYKNKLAVAIKSNGKVLREAGADKDTIFIPFGSEYSILIKNLESVRAQVRLTVDGTDATEGVSLVVPANGEFELERFIKACNMQAGNKFKFIERSASVENHRGVGITDGLIRVEFQFEKRAPVYIRPPMVHHNRYGWGCMCGSPLCGSLYCQVYGVTQTLSTSSPMQNATYCATSNAAQDVPLTKSGILRSASAFINQAASAQMAAPTALAAPVNDVGITVAGSRSDQNFTTSAYFALETEVHTMVLKVLGETPTGKPIIKAVTVKAKPKCTSCGRTNKATAKFCVECGTALEIV